MDPVEDSLAWGLNAMALGGGTRVWQGMAWRFLPEDFEMATRYGVPEGSCLADWPIGYDDLAPYYDRVEWEIGVAGRSDGALTDRFARSRGYPMPALRDDPMREAFGAAADRLGWGWGPVPFAINSEPRDGRAACVHCSQCLGHACVVDAKNGTQNTVIPRALASGNCDLLVDAQVVEIVQSGGRARSVRVVGRRRAHARCAASGSSCARARSRRRGCCWSPASAAPAVGTNLHNHSFTILYGTATTPLERFQGPGHSVATLDFVHRDGEAWGGGVLFDAPSLLPVAAAAAAGRLGVPAWGAGHKEWMRDGPAPPVRRHGDRPGDPVGAARVSRADPSVRDVHGMPVARIAGDLHPATLEVRAYMAERVGGLAATRSASSASPTSTTGRRPPPPASTRRARAGWARTRRRRRATATGGCTAVENVYVADASLLPTNGGVNPCVTTMANAWRVAEGIGGG